MEFPECLEKIGVCAFCGSNIESMSFPTAFRTVAQGAFACCERLRTVLFNDGLEALGTDERPDEGVFYGALEGSAVENV